jgi:DUF2934 family protein
LRRTGADSNTRAVHAIKVADVRRADAQALPRRLRERASRSKLAPYIYQEVPMATRRPSDSPQKPAPTTTPNPAVEKSAPRGKTTRAKQTAAPKPSPLDISENARRGMIAEAAYLRAERRGFMPGFEVEDWLAAEAEVDALLEAEHGSKIPQ